MNSQMMRDFFSLLILYSSRAALHFIFLRIDMRYFKFHLNYFSRLYLSLIVMFQILMSKNLLFKLKISDFSKISIKYLAKIINFYNQFLSSELWMFSYSGWIIVWSLYHINPGDVSMCAERVTWCPYLRNFYDGSASLLWEGVAVLLRVETGPTGVAKLELSPL